MLETQSPAVLRCVGRGAEANPEDLYMPEGKWSVHCTARVALLHKTQGLQDASTSAISSAQWRDGGMACVGVRVRTLKCQT